MGWAIIHNVTPTESHAQNIVQLAETVPLCVDQLFKYMSLCNAFYILTIAPSNYTLRVCLFVCLFRIRTSKLYKRMHRKLFVVVSFPFLNVL